MPSGETVFRFAKPSKDFVETGRISETDFVLSPQDREYEVKVLSAWADYLTTVE